MESRVAFDVDVVWHGQLELQLDLHLDVDQARPLESALGSPNRSWKAFGERRSSLSVQRQ